MADIIYPAAGPRVIDIECCIPGNWVPSEKTGRNWSLLTRPPGRQGNILSVSVSLGTRHCRVYNCKNHH